MDPLLAGLHQLTRAWTAAYTAGLGEAERGARRAEVASDLFEHAYLYAAVGTPTREIAGQVGGRLVRGVVADIAWRLEAGRRGEASVRAGQCAPMPWITSAFLVVILLVSSVILVLSAWIGDAMLDALAVGLCGVAAMFVGLYLSSWRTSLGALLCVLGSAAVAYWLLWVTPPLALVALAFGASAARRAFRLERLRSGLDIYTSTGK